MSKKNNNKSTNRNNSNNNYSYQRSFELPEVVDMEVLSYASDDDLDRRYNMLSNDRDRVANMGGDSMPWEVEIAYLQRELKIRSARKNAHEKFVRSNPDSVYFLDEQSHSKIEFGNRTTSN